LKERIEQVEIFQQVFISSVKAVGHVHYLWKNLRFCKVTESGKFLSGLYAILYEVNCAQFYLFPERLYKKLKTFNKYFHHY
jgi:hypothetical protein